VAAIALSMATTPLMLLLYARVLAPRVGTKAVAPERAPDAIATSGPVIIAGFGQFGSTIGRVLRTQGIRPVVLELDSDRVELLRTLGLEVYYGDASRLELLHSAGISRAALLVIALGDDATTRSLAAQVRQAHPHVRILARATTRSGAFDLLQAGVTDVYRDTLEGAVRVGADALAALGMPRHHAHRVGQAFRRRDEAHVRELAGQSLEWSGYVDRVRANIRALEEALQQEFGAGVPPVQDAAWDDSALRAEFGGTPEVGSPERAG
jgi:voltage-gated potassium channel Kch